MDFKEYQAIRENGSLRQKAALFFSSVVWTVIVWIISTYERERR